MKITYGEWYTIQRCIDCKEILTHDEVIHSHGMCPKCGFIHPGAATVVKTIKTSRQDITTTWFDKKFPFYHKQTTYKER